MRNLDGSALRLLAAYGITLCVGGTAFAQSVRTFDDAPSIEQLRSILTPEVQPGAGRTIVLQKPPPAAMRSPAHNVSVEAAAPRASAGTTGAAGPPPAKVAVVPLLSPASVAIAQSPAKESTAVAFRINFGFDSAILPSSSHAMIDRIAQLMKESPEVKLRVEGHTDAAGSAEYNISLSRRRAAAVIKYLMDNGVDASRLMMVGKGMAEPVTPDPFDPANRRVQFVRIG
jgi:outer membrane protein OmpA-like peptidoglycan-associated protein